MCVIKPWALASAEIYVVHVRVGKSKSTVFISLSGAFQGDSLSGCLFTLTLAGALIHLRAVLDRPNPPISDTCLPLESEYADDVDFLEEDLEALKQILPTATSVLKDWSLNVNEQKTEFARVYLAGKNETDSFGAKIAGNEPWRSTKLLIFTSGLYFVLRAVPARPQYSPLTYSPRKIQPASRRHLI